MKFESTFLLRGLRPWRGLFAFVALASAIGTACAARPRSEPSPAPTAPAVVSGPVTGAGAPARRTFGVPIDRSVPDVALAAIVTEPERYRDQMVRTHGTVVRVCQRMGCWMEMRDEGTPTVRVPMSGHAFFLPRDAQGRPVEIVGRVRIAPLDQATRDHLAGEGATEVASALSIDALGVAVD